MTRMAFDADREGTGLLTHPLATENARASKLITENEKRDAPDRIRGIPSLYALE